MGYIRDRWTKPGSKAHNERWGKGRRWQAVWTDPDTGNSRYRAFATRDAAEELLRNADQPKGSASGQTTTFRQAWERWQSASVHHKASTRASVQQTSDTMILPHIGDLTLAQLDRATLQGLVKTWIEDDGYAASRIQVAWSYITGPLKLAVLDGVIGKTPSMGVKLPKRTRTKVVPLTVEEVETITGRMTPRLKAMVVLGAATGMRSGELRGLTWDRISVDGTITVDRQLLDERQGAQHLEPVFDTPKTPASNRRLKVPAAILQVLGAHRASYPANDTDLVFRSRYGTPVTRKTAGNAWRSAITGMPGMRARSGWHDLRHFHASLLIAGGLSVRAVADRLGHDDPTETLRTYAHLWPTDEGRVLVAVDEALSGMLTGKALAQVSV
ncbi:MAG: site-specific integrase [Propionibacteriaceae bacterium]|jgi:integrase|nr:site-specific integrase [Propionibacteriaceae bacterium]